MVYEMRFYNKKSDWTNENDLYVVVWETDDKKPVVNGNVRGKLLSCLGYGGKTYEVPEGIDTIGTGAFFKSEWDYFECSIEKLIIPALCVADILMFPYIRALSCSLSMLIILLWCMINFGSIPLKNPMFVVIPMVVVLIKII